MIDLYKNIRVLREQLNISQEELAKRTGYTSRSSIAKIEAGEVDLSQSKIDLFAKALNTTPAILLGLSNVKTANVPVISLRPIPVFTPLCCGDGLFNDEDIIEYISLPLGKGEYFCQYAKGDSMINANINDGDLLVFRKDNIPQDNKIGCFCIDNNVAVCKKYRNINGEIVLVSANDDFLPIKIDNTNECFRQVGILVKIIKEVK